MEADLEIENDTCRCEPFFVEVGRPSKKRKTEDSFTQEEEANKERTERIHSRVVSAKHVDCKAMADGGCTKPFFAHFESVGV